MADEVTYGTARAAESGDTEELSKAELQRRMEEARESISQTVAEIKDTVVNQYQSVKESVTETLDWREQYRKRPVAWSLGALGAGFIVGYSVAGVFKGDGYDDDEDTLSPEDSRVFEMPASQLESSTAYSAPRAYAAQAMTGGAYGSAAYAGARETEYDEAQTPSSRKSDYSYGGGQTSAATQQDEEPQGPGLIERFKETKAYDRLQEEVSSLGDRFIDELSKTAQAVVLPAIFSKVKELFGVDLSGKQGGGSGRSASTASTGARPSGGGGSQASQAGGGIGSSAAAAAGASSSGSPQSTPNDTTLAGGRGSGGGSAGGSTGSTESPSSYATSENRPYSGGQGGQS